MRSKKVFVIGAIIVSVVVVALGFFYYSTVVNRPKFEPKLKPETPAFRYPTVDTQEPIVPLQTEEYTLTYPETWQVTLQPIAGGGNSTSFTIAGSAPNEPPAEVSIQGTSVKDTPLTQIETVYASFGYKKETVTVNGTEAAKFSGNMGDMREVAYVLQHNETAYNIKLTYLADRTDAAMEQHFTDVVTSLNFL
jgi:hypothetical protein